VDFSLIDHFEKVSDKDGALMCRRLAKEEGMLLGYSAGSAFAGLLQIKDQLTKDDVVVMVIHDHGSRYVGKIYNDDWMRERGFLEDDLTVKDMIAAKNGEKFISVDPSDTVRSVFNLMKEKDISQLPVVEKDKIIGSITESAVLTHLLENPLKNSEDEIKSIMGTPFPLVAEDLPVKNLTRYISKKIPAVVAKDKAGSMHILTQYDIIQTV